MVRTYSQTQRADSTAATRRAILDAAIELFREERDPDPSLERLAERAGCSTRSVLRHFGSKERLIEAAIADAVAEALEERRVEPGDVEGAVRKIVAHYEEQGDEVMRWLGLAAERFPLVRQVTEAGSRLHRDWVRETFAPDLEGLEAGERRRRVAALATVTDVYVWHLLRRREGLGRAAAEAEILGLVEAARRGAPAGASR
jgi:AcrR family transcriptional regulator